MLEVKNLFFRHKGMNRDILKGVSFLARKGSITTILGPNGSGKTTLFKCIAGLWNYHKGGIYFNDISLDSLSYRKRAKIFSVVPQEHEPPFPYSVFDIVLMGRASYLGFFSSPGKKDFEITENSLKIVGIEHLRDKPYTKISGGERQLTLIARALAQQTPVILLDEPTSHLDFKNQINVLRKIREIATTKDITVLMTLHDPNLSAFFSDKIIVLNFGEKIAEGPPEIVIDEDLIQKIYQIDVKKGKINGKSFLYPVL